MLDALNQFLDETRDTREYKRALAVKMAHEGIAYEVIAAMLQVSKPFISKWKRIYADAGTEGLRIGYHGGTSYLTSDQREQTLAWLRAQESWSVPALQAYLQETFQVVYQSLQSYYDLLHAAGLSWKKTQTTNPKKTTPSLPNAARN
jgi:putative transposase